MASKVEQIAVTQSQFEQVEAAWRICSNGTRRISNPEWSRRFDECVTSVLGYPPPTAYSLARASAL